MKEFKNWFHKEIDAGRDIYPSSHDDCEDAWKAAVERSLEGFNFGIYPRRTTTKENNDD